MPGLRCALLAITALALLAPPAPGASTATSSGKAKSRFPLVRLNGGTTTIAPDPAFVDALAAKGVTATVLSPGELTDSGFAFPVITGRLAGDRPAGGYVRHHGGLRLSPPDGSHLDFDRPRIRDGETAVITAQVGDASRIRLARLVVGDATVKLTKRRFVLSGVGLRITDLAAETLRIELGVDVAGGQDLGTLSVDARRKHR